jgi:peptidoglycan/LPS O-acetylase OafA/YrhL
MNPSSKQFFGGLESLRGIAALMVVFYHIEWTNPLTHHLIFRNGYLMVDLFFVLSGFVICYNYGQKIGNAKMPATSCFYDSVGCIVSIYFSCSSF